MLVGGAADPTEVVSICLKYLSLWSAEQRRALAKDLQPPLAIHTPQNVADYALVLVQGRLKDEHPSLELDAMASFFAAATTRLSRLLAAQPEGNRIPFFVKAP